MSSAGGKERGRLDYLCEGFHNRRMGRVGVVVADFRKRRSVTVKDAGRVYAGNAVAVADAACESGYTYTHSGVAVEVWRQTSPCRRQAEAQPGLSMDAGT